MCVQCILVKSFPKLDLDSFATGLIRGGIKVVAVLGGGVKFYLRKRHLTAVVCLNCTVHMFPSNGL